MPVEAMMKHLGGKFWWASRERFLFPGLYWSTKRVMPVPKRPEPPAIVEFPEQTTVYAKDQPEYRPLPAFRFPNDPQGRIVCCWKLNLRDRIKVLFTGKLWHQILTFNQPLQPQFMLADKPDMPKE